MQKIVFATGNAGKMKEIKMILSDLMVHGEPVEVLSMKEAGVTADIVEDGQSFWKTQSSKRKRWQPVRRERLCWQMIPD